MRLLLVPICLSITAWAQPANPILESASFTAAEKVTAVRKIAATVLPNEPTTTTADAAETSADVIERSQDALIALETDRNLEQDDIENGSPFDETGFVITELDVPLPLQRPLPFPQRRPVPHHLVCATLADAAVDNDIPTPFLIRLIWQESRFNQNAVSPVGAQGVAQFMPRTAAAVQLSDPFNPLEAVRASAALLRELFRKFGNLGLAAAAYNAGPKRVQDWLEKRGALPKETRDYVQRVTGVAPEHWKTQPTAPAVRVAAQVPCQREAGLLAANGPERIPLPPVVQIETAKPAEKAVQLVAALSQKRNGTNLMPAKNSGDMVAKLQDKPATKTEAKGQAKVENKAPEPRAAIKQAAAALKARKSATKPPADKRVTKTVSARTKIKKARTKPAKVAEAK